MTDFHQQKIAFNNTKKNPAKFGTKTMNLKAEIHGHFQYFVYLGFFEKLARNWKLNRNWYIVRM